MRRAAVVLSVPRRAGVSPSLVARMLHVREHRTATRRRGFGAIRRLPSKRYQASYQGPGMRRYVAPTTFENRMDAEAWLIAERRLAERDDWTPPAMRAAARRSAPTLREYAPGAMARRRVRGEPLRPPRTLKLYDGLLERVLYPTFGERQLRTIRAPT